MSFRLHVDMCTLPTCPRISWIEYHINQKPIEYTWEHFMGPIRANFIVFYRCIPGTTLKYYEMLNRHTLCVRRNIAQNIPWESIWIFSSAPQVDKRDMNFGLIRFLEPAGGCDVMKLPDQIEQQTLFTCDAGYQATTLATWFPLQLLNGLPIYVYVSVILPT